jgi:hypothetical protein
LLLYDWVDYFGSVSLVTFVGFPLKAIQPSSYVTPLFASTEATSLAKIIP